MAVPTTINDLSVTASSNGPAGSESPNTLDDYIRAQSSILRKLYNDVTDGTVPAYNATRVGGTTPTAAGLALIDDANAAAQRTTLGLGTAATQASTAFAASGAVTGNGNTMATGKILGRSTVSSGAIEEIAIGSGLTLSSGTLSASASSSLSYTSATTPLPASGGLASALHGLGSIPADMQLELTCLTAEQGYTTGDVVIPLFDWNGANSTVAGVYKNSSVVGWQHGSGSNFCLANKTNGSAFTPTLANWSYRFKIRT